MHHSNGIIIVEDEPLIAIMVEQMAEDLGYCVEGSAGSEDDALSLLGSTEPTAAILDVKLGSTTSLAVAAACKERGIPVIFTTGLPPENYSQFSDGQPVLNKPFSLDQFRAALERISSRK